MIKSLLKSEFISYCFFIAGVFIRNAGKQEKQVGTF